MLRLNLTPRHSDDVPEWLRPILAEHEAKQRAQIDDTRLLLDRERKDLRARVRRESPKHEAAVDAARATIAEAEAALAAARQAHTEALIARQRVVGEAEFRIQRIDAELAWSADPAIDAAIAQLRTDEETTRHAPAESRREKIGGWDRPTYRDYSNGGAIVDRLTAIRAAVELLEALKREVGVDVGARVAEILASVPDASTLHELRPVD